jgi:hypothetical protein
MSQATPVPSPRFFDTLDTFVPAATQAQRRAQWVRFAAHLFRQSFDEQGRWLFPGTPPDTRDRLSLSFGLLQGEPADRALANAILADVRFQQHVPARSQEEAAHPFDIFVTNYALQICILLGDRLTQEVRRKLEGWAKVALNDLPGDRQSDYQFHGYNDNMPSKATAGLILGGEYFNDCAAVQHGLWNLRQLRDMLTRRGLISEYTSPTYLPLTVMNLTHIANHARDREAAQLAGQCAQRLWAEILGHFHPGTGMLGGPYSRAYTTDSAGHLSVMGFLMWLLLGDRARPNPIEELRMEPPRLVLHHRGDLHFNVAQFCVFSTCEYHPPQYLMDWLENRKYPFHLVATAERGQGGGGAWQAGEVLTTHYQEADFAMGTSEGDWGGHAEELFLQYRNREADVRTVFPRYLVNDEAPGMELPSDSGLSQGEHDCLADHGRYHTIQKGRTAMVLVAPHLKLAETPVTSLRFCLVLCEHLSRVEKLWAADGHVWMQDGPLYLALRALGATDWGRKEALRIERVNRYRVVSLINYEGAPRTFSREELGRTVNGFVVTVGTTSDGSFDAFRAQVLKARVLDYYSMGARTVRYRSGDLEMGINYGTESDGIRFMQINGQCVSHPVWQADGLPPQRLPFLDGVPQPNPLPFPYQHLKVVWAPDLPWTIFSRGEENERMQNG